MTPSHVRRALVAGAIAAAAACSVFGRDPDRLDLRFGTDSGSSGSSGGDGDDGGCHHARPPAKLGNAMGGPDLSFSVVISKLEVLSPPDIRGFDIDESCTCPEPKTCIGAANDSLCDGDGGLDNTLGASLEAIPLAKEYVDPEQLRAHFRDGQASVIFYVTKYNGTDNDDDVELYLIRSTGTPYVDAKGTHVKPTFDGQDPFDCVREDVGACGPEGILPSVGPQRAYVRDGQLIAPNVLFYLSIIADFPIRGAGTATARIEPFADGPAGEKRFKLTEGILGGALPLSDLFTALALVEFAPGATVCSKPDILSFLKQQLCGHRDAVYAPDGGALPNCDAISTALSFEAMPFAPHEQASLPVIPPCDAGIGLTCD